MDIHQPAREARDKLWRENAHKTSQHNQIRRLTFQCAGEIGIKGLPS